MRSSHPTSRGWCTRSQCPACHCRPGLAGAMGSIGTKAYRGRRRQSFISEIVRQHQRRFNRRTVRGDFAGSLVSSDRSVQYDKVSSRRIVTCAGNPPNASCSSSASAIAMIPTSRLQVFRDAMASTVAPPRERMAIALPPGWPVSWSGPCRSPDFQDSAGKEVAALQSRQQYLTTLAEQRCASPAPAQTAPVRKR